MIETEVGALSRTVPVGIEHFREYEHMVRVIFNFLFMEKLGEGRWQSRTEPEDEGVEIRDLLFGHKSDSGFWKGLFVNPKAPFGRWHYLTQVSLTISKLVTRRSPDSSLRGAVFVVVFPAFDSCVMRPLTVTLCPRCPSSLTALLRRPQTLPSSPVIENSPGS